MNELVEIQKTISGLATITPDKLAKISERMVEIDRANTLLVEVIRKRLTS